MIEAIDLNPPLLLKGQRIELRPIEKEHVAQFAAWYSQYELLRLLAPGTVAPVNMVAEEAWFDSLNREKNHFTFAIIVRESGKLIGNCTLMNHHGKNRSATLGIAIGDPATRGHGYGTEALQLILEFGFLEMNLNRVELQVLELNSRAKALYDRLGFKLEGTLRQTVFREGRYWDTYVMSLLRDEYKPSAHWKLD
jgi:RimJ/RimL family protein N-acetyltransferase